MSPGAGDGNPVVPICIRLADDPPIIRATRMGASIPKVLLVA